MNRILVILFLTTLFCQTRAQEASLYCYENPETEYVEWLYFQDDSAMVLGFMEKRCSDGLNLEIWKHRNESNIQKWPVTHSEDGMEFTKILRAEAYGIVLNYNYSCQVEDEGLKVRLEYTPASLNFQDRSGPPDRYYHKFASTDKDEFQKIFIAE